MDTPTNRTCDLDQATTHQCKHGNGGEANGCVECIDELASDYEDYRFEFDGEAAYGRED